jgi:hypothetical protein
MADVGTERGRMGRCWHGAQAPGPFEGPTNIKPPALPEDTYWTIYVTDVLDMVNVLDGTKGILNGNR